MSRSTDSGRPIDAAMLAKSPAKDAVRGLWSSEVMEFKQKYGGVDVSASVPLFLTLPGAEGLDIERLLMDGVIERTDTGAISPEDLGRIVAVESNQAAVTALLTRYPAITAYPVNFADLIAGEALSSFPDSEKKKIMRARVINLDLNAPLNGKVVHGEVRFSVLSWIQKVAQIHRDPTPIDWCLCLTVNSDITSAIWPASVQKEVQRCLRDNMSSDKVFRTSCGQVFGKSLRSQVESTAPLKIDELSASHQQKVLMAFVPKRITELVADAWKIDVRTNLCYGGSGNRASMVSWIIHFHHSPTLTRATRYKDGVRSSLSHAAKINSRGTVQEFLGTASELLNWKTHAAIRATPSLLRRLYYNRFELRFPTVSIGEHA